MMISLKESAINKTSKYKVRRDIDDSLSFETDGGVVFRVGFVEDNMLGIPDVYQFYILNVLNVKSHNDSNVRMTISSILEIFFLNRDCVLHTPWCVGDDVRTCAVYVPVGMAVMV